MQTFPIGSDAIIKIPFVNDAGAPVTPTALSYVVRDELGDVVVQMTDIADLAGTSTTITVPAASHEAEGGYSVELFVTDDNGTYIREVVYGIVATQRLVYLKNSLQTYTQAIYRTRDLQNLDAFLANDKETQCVALIESFRRLTLMNYTIPWPEYPDVQSLLMPEWVSGLSPRMWPLMTADLYERYPVDFRNALADAQVIEASAVLTTDGVNEKMRMGLLAWTVGESKMMFKSGVRPLEGHVSSATMKRLQGWLNNRITLNRV